MVGKELPCRKVSGVLWSRRSLERTTFLYSVGIFTKNPHHTPIISITGDRLTLCIHTTSQGQGKITLREYTHAHTVKKRKKIGSHAYTSATFPSCSMLPDRVEAHRLTYTIGTLIYRYTYKDICYSMVPGVYNTLRSHNGRVYILISFIHS